MSSTFYNIQLDDEILKGYFVETKEVKLYGKTFMSFDSKRDYEKMLKIVQTSKTRDHRKISVNICADLSNSFVPVENRNQEWWKALEVEIRSQTSVLCLDLKKFPTIGSKRTEIRLMCYTKGHEIIQSARDIFLNINSNNDNYVCSACRCKLEPGFENRAISQTNTITTARDPTTYRDNQEKEESRDRYSEIHQQRCSDVQQKLRAFDGFTEDDEEQLPRLECPSDEDGAVESELSCEEFIETVVEREAEREVKKEHVSILTKLMGNFKFR